MDSYFSFRRFANVVLGGMTGVMIAYPFAVSSMPSGLAAVVVILILFTLGLLIGYRRRNSGLFLYFCMLAIIILAVVISFSLPN